MENHRYHNSLVTRLRRRISCSMYFVATVWLNSVILTHRWHTPTSVHAVLYLSELDVCVTARTPRSLSVFLHQTHHQKIIFTAKLIPCQIWRWILKSWQMCQNYFDFGPFLLEILYRIMEFLFIIYAGTVIDYRKTRNKKRNHNEICMINELISSLHFTQ